MRSSIRRSAALALALSAAHCAGSVGTQPDLDGGALADGARPADSAVASVSPSCAEVRATCGAAPATVVRGHAEGLTGLDGARAHFAIRYLLEEGQGLNTAHGVAGANATVQGGAFEACVCVPHGANVYPEVVAVVFAPGSAGATGGDVRRAMFSQRYATLGEEDLSQDLAGAPSAATAEAAVAGLVQRSVSLRVSGLDAAPAGARVFAGLIASERPVAAQLAGGEAQGGSVALAWNNPGQAWPSEALALVVDANANNQCDEGDVGGTVALGGRTEVAWQGSAWLRGAALMPVCNALAVGAARGQ